MSVMGELKRHVDALIDELERADDARLTSLREKLEVARPTRLDDLSASADRILATLDEAGLADAEDRDRQDLAPALLEAASTVAKLCRIVLGR